MSTIALVTELHAKLGEELKRLDAALASLGRAIDGLEETVKTMAPRAPTEP